MGMISRADAYQRKHRWVGLPLAVIYKFFDDQGSYLAAQITYYGIVSLFPLLLLLTTFLGYGLHDSLHFQQQVLDSALAQFPVVGDQIALNIHSFHGSLLGLVIGIVGCLYGGLGIVQATQNALNKVWGVPRNARPNPIRARLRSLLLLAAGGGSVLVTIVLTALGAAANSYGVAIGVGLRAAATALAVALNVTLFMVAFRVLTARPVTLRQTRAGAIAAAVIWQFLQLAGAILLGHKLKHATATYGLFAIVLGLLAWVYLGAVTVVMCAEFNAVRARQMWPRSLLAPFTDNVDLTPGDQRAYTSYALTEGHKSFETIDVTFGKPPQPALRPIEGTADSTVLLFSYGTLQEPRVQLANFGRYLDGTPDALPGHRMDWVTITDPEVIAASGSDRHPIVRPTGEPGDRVPGTVFAISAAELAAADSYEVDDYRRVLARLCSGTDSWVYLAAGSAG